MRPIPRVALRPYVCTSCRHGIGSNQRRFGTQPGQKPDIYDVVVVGAGPAGLSLLASLRASPITSKLRVALIESQDLRKAQSWKMESDQFSNRCSSLTPSSVSFLRDIGAWEHLALERVQKYQGMQVWDGETGSRISFDWSGETSAFEELRTVATMAENTNIVSGLLRRIAASGDENMTLFSNTTVVSIENGSDLQACGGPDLSAWPVLSVKPTGPASEGKSPSRIAARLLVGADGINSPVRSFANIPADGWDYNRHGVVATLALGDLPTPPIRESMRTAYQRFLPDLGGPIALLPLPDNHASLVWSTTPTNAAYLKSLPTPAFIAMINAAFRLSMTDLNYMMGMQQYTESTHEDELTWRVRNTPLPSQTPPPVIGLQTSTLASFPLRFRHADQYISPRLALVGDAAHVIHPLAGQGLNLGLGDVAALSRTIEYAVSHGMDIGDLLTLERYSSERYFTNSKVMGACDLLHKMYTVPGQNPISWARSAGLTILDKLPFAKSFLMKNAEGY
ncbi:Monooxygenase FAD-binding [Penicillium taxi]|uniref:Monooxygenase FAD-binding n=1 Tax=Penicillium taxi TaxID=168475 RepID=UPI0025451AD1|nr:Monooxygenase FAD-binding [Penicillium taxi]KAJ5898964.1 Monooxygenase FAD-binding [Penicillium taxi]